MPVGSWRKNSGGRYYCLPWVEPRVSSIGRSVLVTVVDLDVSRSACFHRASMCGSSVVAHEVSMVVDDARAISSSLESIKSKTKPKAEWRTTYFYTVAVQHGNYKQMSACSTPVLYGT